MANKHQNDLVFDFDKFEFELPAESTIHQLNDSHSTNVVAINRSSRAKRKEELCKRITDADTIITKHRKLQDELMGLYEFEKNRRIKLEEEIKNLKQESELCRNQTILYELQCEQLRASLKESKTIPVKINHLITNFIRLANRAAGSPQLMSKADLEMVMALKEHCAKNNISMPKSPKKKTSENDTNEHKLIKPAADVLNLHNPAVKMVDKAVDCSIWSSTPVYRKADKCTRGTQCDNVQINRSTSTECLIEQFDCGTMFPEPTQLGRVYEILDEMTEWNIMPISPIPASEIDKPKMVSIGTCTKLYDVRNEINYVSFIKKIKRSNSRPPSRANVKIETDLITEMHTIMLDYFKRHLQCNFQSYEALLDIWKILIPIFVEAAQNIQPILLGATSLTTASATTTYDKNEAYAGILRKVEDASLDPSTGEEYFNNERLQKYPMAPLRIRAPSLNINQTSQQDLLVTNVRNNESEHTHAEKELVSEIGNLNLSSIEESVEQILPGPGPLVSESNPLKINSLCDTNKYIFPQDLLTDEDSYVTTAEDNDTNMQKCQSYSGELSHTLLKQCINNEILNCQNDSDIRRIHLYPKIDSANKSLNTVTENQENAGKITVLNSENDQDEEEIDVFNSLPTSTNKVSSNAHAVSFVKNFSNNFESTDWFAQLNENEKKLLQKEKMAIDSMSNSTNTSPNKNAEQQESQKTFANVEQVMEAKNDYIENKNESLVLAEEITANDLTAKCIDIQSNTNEGFKNNKEQLGRQKKRSFVKGKLYVDTPKKQKKKHKEESCLPNQNSEVCSDFECVADSPNNDTLVIDENYEELTPNESVLHNESQISTTTFENTLESPCEKLEGPDQIEMKPILPKRSGRKRKSETVASTTPILSKMCKRSARLEAKRLNLNSENTQHLINCSVQQEMCTKNSKPATTPIENNKSENQNLACDTIYETPHSPAYSETDKNPPQNIPLELNISEDYLKKQNWIQIIPKSTQLPKAKRFSLQKKKNMLITVEKYLKTQGFSEQCMIKNNKELFLLQLLEHIQETPELNLKPVLLSLHQSETVSIDVIMNNIVDKLCKQKCTERPSLAAALNLTKAYLECIDLRLSLTPNYQNPARYFIVQILYYFKKEAMRLVYEVLCKFPTVLPHRDTPDYNDSDAIITVIKHELMQYKYDMNDVESCGREMLSKLRFEYYFKAYQPTFKEVLEQLINNLKAGQLEHLELAFSLFCKRMVPGKALDVVINGHLVPLAHSYYDLANQSDAYDERLEMLIDCISVTVKALPLETDVKEFLNLFKRFYTQGFRTRIQEAAVRGIIRLQRFGFVACKLALDNFRPSYVLQAKTTIMLRTFAERSSQFQKNKKRWMAEQTKLKRGPKMGNTASNSANKANGKGVVKKHSKKMHSLANKKKYA